MSAARHTPFAPTLRYLGAGYALRAYRRAFFGTAATLTLAASASAQSPFDLADPARVAKGKSRFGANCAAYCHGAEGVGGRAPSMKGNPNFSADAAYKAIAEGRRGGSDVMPPWGNAFTPEQIWELVAYLKYLSAQ